MKESTHCALRSLLPAWVFCLLLPLPAGLFWHSHDGRFIALCCFFVGSTSVVVWSFRDVAAGARAVLAATTSRPPGLVWRERLATAALALLAAWVVFSTSCLVLNDPHDLVAPVLALASLVPALCIAPYLTLATGKPFAAVVLTLFSMGCMKMVAGGVTCLVYGWHASELGHTNMPWTHPNLIVWAFVVSAALLSASFYVLGARRFQSMFAGAAESGAALSVS